MTLVVFIGGSTIDNDVLDCWIGLARDGLEAIVATRFRIGVIVLTRRGCPNDLNALSSSLLLEEHRCLQFFRGEEI